MVRAARIDVELYREVKEDTWANKQAFAVVALVSLAIAIGTGLPGFFTGAVLSPWGFLVGLVASLAAWSPWALLAYWLGTAPFFGGRILKSLSDRP
jgi:hypothetical protein